MSARVGEIWVCTLCGKPIERRGIRVAGQTKLRTWCCVAKRRRVTLAEFLFALEYRTRTGRYSAWPQADRTAPHQVYVASAPTT
jgi:hypothetical protein